MEDNDVWGAFGSDSDDDDDDSYNGEGSDNSDNIPNDNGSSSSFFIDSAVQRRNAETVGLFLAQSFLKKNAQVALRHRRVLLLLLLGDNDSNNNNGSSLSSSSSSPSFSSRRAAKCWRQALVETRGIRHLDCCSIVARRHHQQQNEEGIQILPIPAQNEDSADSGKDSDDSSEGNKNNNIRGPYDAVILLADQPPVGNKANSHDDTADNVEDPTNNDSNKNHNEHLEKNLEKTIQNVLLPAGLLLLPDRWFRRRKGRGLWDDASIWKTEEGHDDTAIATVYYNPPSSSSGSRQEGNNDNGTNKDDDCLVAITKLSCRIQEKTCPWLSARHCLFSERRRLQQATISLSAYEVATSTCTESSIQKAVRSMQNCGYCVLPGLLFGSASEQHGQAVLEDLAAAAEILRRTDKVDLKQPGGNEPATYKELSMREDLRMDLRSGPALNKLRSSYGGNEPWTIRANTKTAKDGDGCAGSEQFLRGHKDVLDIVRRVMNPVEDDNSTNGSKQQSEDRVPLFKGNFGRYNFDGGGPDGSFQDLRVGPVGGIVSLPGAADQALHADTPHLFEHISCMPAHYINAFTPGCPSHDRVGQTALIHTSHCLDFTARYCAPDDGNENQQQQQEQLWKHLVRPRLELGDVLLFDCRILHFGLANHASSNVERPLLYTNMTMHWFHDPKNWDDQRSIFSEHTNTTV